MIALNKIPRKKNIVSVCTVSAESVAVRSETGDMSTDAQIENKKRPMRTIITQRVVSFPDGALVSVDSGNRERNWKNL